ncbi:MAG: DUF1838 family protein [Rhodospirillaceae bacterium]|nr:DUF1838 family protein [Rhodospirillaceae bacterium]
MKRRTALGTLGAAPFISATFGRQALAQSDLLKLDPSNPDHNLMIFRKLAHTMDDSIAFFWANLRRMGQEGPVATPMWDIKLASVLGTTDVGEDGTYETTAISMVAYTDTATGEVLEKFDNPWTGETVDISLFPAAPMKRLITKDGVKGPMIERDGTLVDHASPIGPSFIQGDEVWVFGDDMTTLRSDDGERKLIFGVNDWSTFKGKLADVADPSNGNPLSDWYFNDILTWSPWLKMPGHPGNMISRGFGAKVRSFDEMPADILALTKRMHPKVYADPRAALGL